MLCTQAGAPAPSPGLNFELLHFSCEALRDTTLLRDCPGISGINLDISKFGCGAAEVFHLGVDLHDVALIFCLGTGSLWPLPQIIT